METITVATISGYHVTLNLGIKVRSSTAPSLRVRMNPFESPRSDTEADDRGLKAKEILGFGLGFVTVFTLIGVGVFELLHYSEPFPRIDITYFRTLYGAIGAVSGLLSGFETVLVTRSRCSFASIAILNGIVFMLIAALAITHSFPAVLLVILALLGSLVFPLIWK